MESLDESKSRMVSKLAVLGSPVKHSLSPVIHRAAYKALGLNWEYEAFEISDKDLEAFLMSHEDYIGFSLTMPLKSRLFEIAREHGWSKDAVSDSLTAANTFFRSETGPAIFNTDVFGAAKALSPIKAVAPSSLAVIGGGATARSTSLAAISEIDSLNKVTVFSRSQENSNALIALLSGGHLNLEVQWLPLEAAADFGGADLTINTLPSDVAKNYDLDRPLSAGWIFDVNYAASPGAFAENWPLENRISGFEMLIWQAVAQIRIFTTGDPETPLNDEEKIVGLMRFALL